MDYQLALIPCVTLAGRGAESGGAQVGGEGATPADQPRHCREGTLRKFIILLSYAVFRIRDILVRIRIREFVPLTNDTDSALFGSDTNKK
jgi:hypothetical protein